MKLFNQSAQAGKSRGSRMSSARTLAVILLGLASASTIFAGGVQPLQRQVKVERKPKFIANGAGQKPFNVTRHTVPLGAIRRAVPRDAIPTLLHPTFVTASEVGRLLKAKDRVLGVDLNGVAKAYPIRILNWHELVSDEVGGQPILVSW